MKTVWKILSRLLIGVIVLALVAGAGGAYYFKSYLPNKVAPLSFPQIDGTIKVEGLDSPVDIYRDQMGVPHIYASTTHDLFFAQGYVHAQERFWQMDFWRHVGSARLSEMFGASQVETDSFLRTLGWRQVAEREYEALDPAARALLDAYSAGVNAYIADRTPEELSLEYAILGLPILTPDYKIEPWTGVNTLTWGKGMAWDLGGALDGEIERAIMLKTLTPEQVAKLYPPYPEDHPVIVPEMGGQSSVISEQSLAISDQLERVEFDSVLRNFALLDAILGERGPDIGSNSWAVSGKLTTTGKPLFANDMHLGIRIPSIWIQNALHCRLKSADCPFDVTGFTFPGVPGVVAGHNDRIAWGFTNLGPDVQDLYIERVNPDNPNQYEVNGQWVDFETRKEIIQVGGGDPVEITVRLTRHGPVISETYGPLKNEVDPEDPLAVPFKDRAGVALPEQYVISLAWTALTPGSPFETIWKFDQAQNWDEFREAARGWSVPGQNVLYADVDGNIGYQSTGVVPIRKKGDGTLPVPGWTDEYGWDGFIPFEDMPYSFNPESGYIVTANNQANPRDYPYLISADWDYGQRAARIVDMIENAPGKIDIAYFQTMHGDAQDLGAMGLLPIWEQIDFQAATPNQAYALDLMLKWDYQSASDSQAAAVYQRFWWNLLQNTINDDLPENEQAKGGKRGGGKDMEVMRRLAQTPDDFFWDDKTTKDTVETRDDIYIASLIETVEQLEKEYGKNPANWPAWGDLHTATFRNETLGKSGIFLIEDLFNRGPFSVGGGKSLVNATGWKLGVSFEVDWLPSEREIVDLSNLNNSLAIHTTGQSGHAYHPHYIDMAPLWATIQYYPMWWEQESVIADAEGHLVLTP
ncbi:MAG: penicillin acylase family protein [Chloroflexota bacterium]